MALTPAQVRTIVSTLKTTFDALLVDVDHEACTGRDGDGKKTYAAAETYSVFKYTYEGQARRAKVSRIIGPEDVDGPTLIFLEDVDISTEDRITMPDGSTPPINAVLPFAEDPDGGSYGVEVRFGRPERGVIS